MPRKSRQRSLPAKSFLYPINYLDFGDPEKDPCFGKLYSLSAPECQACGDIELCGVVFAEKQKQKRISEEKKIGTKDLELYELEFEQRVKDYFNDLVLSGKYSKVKALKKTSMKFNINLSKTKSLIQKK